MNKFVRMDATRLVSNAKGDSVTYEVLTESKKGGLLSKGYESIESHLQEGEQPHYIFEVMVPFGGSGKTHHHIVITDRGIRSISAESVGHINYDAITNIARRKKKDLTGPNKLYLVIETTGGDTYKYRFSSGESASWVKGVDEVELQSAINYIQRQRPHASNSSTESRNADSKEKLKDLKELYDEGVISKDEFEKKKKSLLDDF